MLPKIGLLLVLFFLCACGTAPTQPSALIQPPATVGSTAYLGPTANSGYPGPKFSTPQVPRAVVVTVDPNLGIVHGVLLWKHKPVVGQTLYLSEMIKDAAGVERIAALDLITSPRTDTDEKGQFRFVNVPPKNYGLVLNTFADSYLLQSPQTGYSVIASVTGPTPVDLGILDYEDLPLPPLSP